MCVTEKETVTTLEAWDPDSLTSSAPGPTDGSVVCITVIRPPVVAFQRTNKLIGTQKFSKRVHLKKNGLEINIFS